MAETAAEITELVFDQTEMGTIRTRYSSVTKINAETIVETQAKALLFRMRLEAIRKQLASGQNDLGDVSYYRGRI